MFNSLKGKIIIPMVGVIIVMVSFIVVHVSIAKTELADELINERIVTVSKMAHAYIDTLSELNQFRSYAISENSDLVSFVRDWNDGADRNQTREDLLRFLMGRKDSFGVDNIVVVDRAGTVIVRTHEPLRFGDSVNTSEHMSEALSGRIFTVYSSSTVLPMALSAAAPVWEDGVIIGAVEMVVNMHTSEFADKISSAFNAHISIFAGNMRVATTLQDENGERLVGVAAPQEVSDLVLGKGESYIIEIDLLGKPFLAYYLPLRGWDGTPVGMLFAGFPNDMAAAAINNLQYNLIIIAIVSIVIVVAGMFLYTMWILKPLDMLADNLCDIAEGEADLTKRIPEKGHDQIAKASHYFNITMEDFRQMILAIKSQLGVLSDIGNDLAGNMTETALSMNQITANIQNIKSRVLNQSASVSQTNATMERVTVNIDKLNVNVERQSSAVSRSSSAIEEMLANIDGVTATLAKNTESVEELQESSEAGISSLQEVAEDIQEISRESEGLLEINALMENIASQTNLLSMNAAIEAAHAGDAGKGFAVVADEIRKLAESSSEQSRTIGNVLKKIKESIDKISGSTGKVMNKFETINRNIKTVSDQEENIRYAMKEQGQGSKQILESSGLVKEVTQQVKGGSVEMLEGSKEVIHESKNLETTTREITTGINEMAAGAEQVNKAVNSVNKLSGKNRESIASLVHSLSQFKV